MWWIESPWKAGEEGKGNLLPLGQIVPPSPADRFGEVSPGSPGAQNADQEVINRPHGWLSLVCRRWPLQDRALANRLAAALGCGWLHKKGNSSLLEQHDGISRTSAQCLSNTETFHGLIQERINRKSSRAKLKACGERSKHLQLSSLDRLRFAPSERCVEPANPAVNRVTSIFEPS
jgi:hypothetical protein